MLSASLAPFVVAVLASAIGTLVVRNIAWHRGVVSSPRADRWHPRPTPLLGGVALWLATLGTTLERATYFGRRFGLDEESSLFTQQLSTTLLALPTREP